MIDLPFALPTAVAGIALTAPLRAQRLARALAGAIGIQVAYTPLGITVALVFIGLPFVVRVAQPVLAEVERELEEAAATLGAGRWQIVRRVVLPALCRRCWPVSRWPSRAASASTALIFIAGNIPQVSEIAPLLITIKLEEFDYAGATAIAAAMLLLSFALLLVINSLQAAAGARRAQGRRLTWVIHRVRALPWMQAGRWRSKRANAVGPIRPRRPPSRAGCSGC